MSDRNQTAKAHDYATFPRRFISYRWFKPLFVVALGFVFMLIFQIVTFLMGAIWAHDPSFISNVSTSYDDMNPYTGPGALSEIGGIAVLLPALALAALIVRDRPFSSYSSSRNGWNWSAFFKCLALAAIIMGVFTVVGMLIPGEDGGDGIIRFTFEGVVLCMILIPLQCVAEEYVFRGLILQTVGAWTKLPAIGIVVSAAIFASGHPYNLIGVITIFINGIVWGVVAWQTKGLEATSAVHIVNNMLAFFLGGFGLQATTSEIDILSMIVAVAVDVIFAVAVILLGKKYNWFSSKGDGTAAFNEKVRAKRERKQQARLANRPVSPA